MFTKKRNRAKVTLEIRGFIDGQIKGKKASNYAGIIRAVARKYGVRVSKSLVSKRARALNIEFRRGRKRLASGTALVEKGPARSIFLDCAGAFFLKGAQLKLGLLATMDQMFKASTESAKARQVLRLARQINAILLYAPGFGLKTAQEIADYNRRGLLYLTGQKALPDEDTISLYLRYLTEQKLLRLIIKEVAKNCAEALLIRVDFAGQIFYLDAQSRTVWPNPKIPQYLSSTLNTTKSYVKYL